MPRFDLNAAFYGGPGFTLYHAWGHNGAMPLSPHFHDEYLICAQVRGVEECHVSGRLQEFVPGDVVLINPQQVHTGNTRGNEAVEYISLYVDRDVVRRLAHEAGAATDSPEFTVVKRSGHPVVIDKLRALLDLVRERDTSALYPTDRAPSESDMSPLASVLGGGPRAGDDAQEGEHEHHRDGSDGERRVHVPEGDLLSIDSALGEVVVNAFEEFSNLRRPMLRSTNRISHRKIARAVEFIRDLDPQVNPASVSLDELAEVAGLSKYHFLRQFSQVVGMTPGAYLRTLRLCHAARKLRTTNLPILDIALSVGFADHPSFSRAFARHMGMTPSEYQKLGPL